jgi:molybdopterin molybdotransferase
MNSAAQSAGVLSFDEAYAVIQAYCRQILGQTKQSEELPLLQSLNRILAEPVLADRDFPPFPRATRDGYAVRAANLNQNGSTSLRVVGQVRAGDSYDLPVASGEAVEIMTGAAVPPGADAVVMVEYTQVREREGTQREERDGERKNDTDDVLESLAGFKGENAAKVEPDDWVEIKRAVSAGENIVPAGAEAKAGQELLRRGTRMGPAQIAMAAASGAARLKVFAKPRVAILSTGDELVDVAEKPGPSQIRNSNSYSLAALVAVNCGEPVQLPIAPDEESKLTELVREGLKADLLLLSGGVSMGKFDLVEKVLTELGAEFFFTGAMIQPGKPVVFGVVDKTPFFGLPGNPVSVMVTFDLFARQVIEALSGAAPSRLKSATAKLKKEFKTKTGLTRFLPAILQGEMNDPEIEVVPWQGSGDMLAAARANCYLVVPPDKQRLSQGEMVTILLR